MGTAVCTHLLYTGLYNCLISSLGADPFTVLFSHVVESWKSTNTPPIEMPGPLQETGVLANQKH